jgi:integrase
LIATGMRRAEASALRWRNIDFDKGTVAVSSVIVELKGGRMVEKATKTAKSRRTIGLPPSIVAELRALYAQVEARCAEAGVIASEQWLFETVTGIHMKPYHISKHVRAQLQAAGTKLRTHDMRHTHATSLLHDKVPLGTVSRRLGHASSQITLSVYEHAIPGEDDLATASAEKLV